MECLALRRCYNWQWWCSSRRDAISFALFRMSEQKAHSKLDSSYFPLPLLFPPPSTCSLAPSLLSISYIIRLWYRTAATLLPINGLKSEISTRISNSMRLIRISNFHPSAININIFMSMYEMKTGYITTRLIGISI